MASSICRRLFTTGFINCLRNGNLKIRTKDKIQKRDDIAFSEALYEAFTSLFDASKELGKEYKDDVVVFGKLFSTHDLRWFDKITSASDFYEKGPANNANGIQVSIAAPLLNHLITTTDSAIQQKKYNAVLRFTHAEAISPLATFMEIPQASFASHSAFTFDAHWQASAINRLYETYSCSTFTLYSSFTDDKKCVGSGFGLYFL